jgi:hypothetical protein
VTPDQILLAIVVGLIFGASCTLAIAAVIAELRGR